MFTAPDVEPRRLKSQGKAKGHEIATKVNKDGKITITFDEARGTWKAFGDYNL